MEVLAVVLLAVRDDRFGFAELVEHDHELAALDLLNFTRQEIADSARELVADLGPLAFPNPLDDSLLRRLNRGSAELGKINRNLHLITDLEVGILETSFLEGDLARRIGHFLHHGLEEDYANGAFVLIDVDFCLHRWSVLLGESGVDAVLEKPVQFGAVDLLRVSQLADRRKNFY